jgi:hypothetical protein
MPAAGIRKGGIYEKQGEYGDTAHCADKSDRP